METRNAAGRQVHAPAHLRTNVFRVLALRSMSRFNIILQRDGMRSAFIWPVLQTRQVCGSVLSGLIRGSIQLGLGYSVNADDAWASGDILNPSEADAFQIVKSGVVELGWAGWIFGVAGG